jgi:hypothetical protein
VEIVIVDDNEEGAFMKIAAVVTIAIAMLSGPLLAQETRPVPKDSMRVTVPGCAKGYVFTAGPKTEDQVGRSDIPEGMHLRMTGAKKMMAEIKPHEGQMIQITGLMKKGQYNSTGINVGGGVRITPGTGSPSGNRPAYTVAPTNYIDVESWQPTVGNCSSR